MRSIRNSSIGHPTQSDEYLNGKKVQLSYHQISQRSLSKSGFDLISSYSDGSTQTTSVNILDLSVQQERYITQAVNLVIEFTFSITEQHKVAFRMEKLADLFKRNEINHNFSKVEEATYMKTPILATATTGIDGIKDIVDTFMIALERRNKEYYERFKNNEYVYIQHAIEHYISFLTRVEEDTSMVEDKRDSYIFINFLKTQVDAMREWAEQIDDEYSED